MIKLRKTNGNSFSNFIKKTNRFTSVIAGGIPH
ncbi:hypothetical protein C806_04573 [Lachnospiraceae bacterium 3-1]|nr:hypothetical protein C806_04573 [Lachnospiraceae bacterium 3-1]